MKKIALLSLIILIVSCSNKPSDLIVKGNVKGLKKGTIYLKKIKDTLLVTVDSLIVNGNSEFEFKSGLESPEMFFLYLDKNSNEEDRISFFADKGITEINTTLKNFMFDAKITGSEQQKTLEEYQRIMSKLNGRNLDLIKETFEAKGDTAKINILDKEYSRHLKRKYLFTVNFALNNKDSEVAPYLALSEIYNAQVKYLDTINSVLTPKVKTSKYGKKLQEFIDKIKTEEKEK